MKLSYFLAGALAQQTNFHGLKNEQAIADIPGELTDLPHCRDYSTEDVCKAADGCYWCVEPDKYQRYEFCANWQY